ncbi:MAG: ABC transporter ATP-binding protein [Candidatus Reddybacter sp.]
MPILFEITNMPPVIEVKHLTKEYNLGTITSAKDTLRHTLARLSGKKTWSRKNFKALDDINFTIEQGEVVGIIGHNGAGKSTLLKHLANITKPTRGDIIVNGSIAPLIEVGAGVSPELTGRENIFLNGAILGIPKKVIQGKIDEIIDFSELEQFIDTPVKRYSSGMTVKLGFSIATSMDADILIIDEVLAVGDLAFQRKCFDRMEELIQRQGRTVLLVSHNLRQVARMCSRVIMLDHGKVVQDGDPDTTCNAFYEYNNQKILANNKKNASNQQQGSGLIQLEKIETIQINGNPTNFIQSCDPLIVRMVIVVNQKIEDPEFVLGTHTTDFVYLTANSTDTFDEWPKTLLPGRHEITCQWVHFPLKAGPYAIRLSIFNCHRGVLFSAENLALFTINEENISKQPPLRLLNIDCKWQLSEYDSNEIT